MDMNNVSYNTTHTFGGPGSAEQWNPEFIDTVAVLFPNRRLYYYVEWAVPDWNASHVDPPMRHPWKRTRATLKQSIHVMSNLGGDDEIDDHWLARYKATQQKLGRYFGGVMVLVVLMFAACVRLRSQPVCPTQQPSMIPSAYGVAPTDSAMQAYPYGSEKGSAFYKRNPGPADGRYEWLWRHQNAK